MMRRRPLGPGLRFPLKRSSRGGSGAFLAKATDGDRYWCKPVNNLQDPRVPTNEQLVGRWAALIGVAVCRVELLEVTADVAGWEFRPGRDLEVGWVHGSRAVSVGVEIGALDQRSRDENAHRHAGYFALHDWLFGADGQWIVVEKADAMYYSFDHGHYFPTGPAWTIDTLEASVDEPHELALPHDGLDVAELLRLAGRLESVTIEELNPATQLIPADWPVSDTELEAVASFAARRAAPAAARLRMLAQGGR